MLTIRTNKRNVSAQTEGDQRMTEHCTLIEGNLTDLRTALAADGYRPWTSTVGAVRQQSPIPVILDPRWRTDFRTTKPTAVIERKPCPCKKRTAR
jgi:hypothetical protein